MHFLSVELHSCALIDSYYIKSLFEIFVHEAITNSSSNQWIIIKALLRFHCCSL